MQPIYALIMHRPYIGGMLLLFNLVACGDTNAVLEHLSAFPIQVNVLLGQRPPSTTLTKQLSFQACSVRPIDIPEFLTKKKTSTLMQST